MYLRTTLSTDFPASTSEYRDYSINTFSSPGAGILVTCIPGRQPINWATSPDSWFSDSLVLSLFFSHDTHTHICYMHHQEKGLGKVHVNLHFNLAKKILLNAKGNFWEIISKQIQNSPQKEKLRKSTAIVKAAII